MFKLRVFIDSNMCILIMSAMTPVALCILPWGRNKILHCSFIHKTRHSPVCQTADDTAKQIFAGSLLSVVDQRSVIAQLTQIIRVSHPQMCRDER